MDFRSFFTKKGTKIVFRSKMDFTEICKNGMKIDFGSKTGASFDFRSKGV